MWFLSSFLFFYDISNISFRVFYTRFHFERNVIFWIWCLVNLLELFTWNTKKWSLLWLLFHCSHFDRDEISFRVIKCYVNTTLKRNYPEGNISACKYFIKIKTVNENIRAKTNFISFRQQWKLTIFFHGGRKHHFD